MSATRLKRWNPRIVPMRGARWLLYGVALAAAAPLAERAWERRAPFNGFDVDATELASRIEGAGPGRDDIPALADPATLPARAAGFLQAHDHVLGAEIRGEARAYPLRILNWHEVVNDRLGDEPVLITWCPLCRSGLAFRPVVDGERLRFGVSGLLYQGNLLMYDRGTRSLWSQITGEAISGPLRGRRLRRVAVRHQTWSAWQRRHPRSTVLSADTGYDRDYASDPYAALAGRASAASLRAADGEPAARALVVGVERDGEAKAWPLSRLALRAPAGAIRDDLGRRTLTLHYDAIAGTAAVRDAGGAPVPSTLVYWSVWRSFYPDGALWTGRPEPAAR